MKAYLIHTDGEKEIITGNTVFEALRFYCDLTDKTIQDFEKNDEIEEILPDKWSEHVITNTEYDESDPTDTQTYTLATLMEDCVHPELLSSTAY